MSIFSLFIFVLFLGVCGVGLYFIDKYIPMERHIKILLNVVVLIALIIGSFLWITESFGLWGAMHMNFTPVHHYHH